MSGDQFRPKALAQTCIGLRQMPPTIVPMRSGSLSPVSRYAANAAPLPMARRLSWRWNE